MKFPYKLIKFTEENFFVFYFFLLKKIPLLFVFHWHEPSDALKTFSASIRHFSSMNEAFYVNFRYKGSVFMMKITHLAKKLSLSNGKRFSHTGKILWDVETSGKLCDEENIHLVYSLKSNFCVFEKKYYREICANKAIEHELCILMKSHRTL
jgi:hypothetical protein